VLFRRNKEPRTLLDRFLDRLNQFADDLEFATRRKKRLDRDRVERGLRTILGLSNAAVQAASVLFPSAKIVAQATKFMGIANAATEAMKTKQIVPHEEETEAEEAEEVVSPPPQQEEVRT
jgi:hypothetical protein